MPRAKVRPEDRQRSAIACLPCKRAKIRCDSGTPCATCSKRGRESACIYQEDPEGGTRPRKRSRTSKSENAFDGVFVGNEESKGPQSRILLSSKLQKVYVGETAVISYLGFLRLILRHRVGPCAFTEGDFNNFMLENDIASNGSAEDLNVLEPGERLDLARVYLEASSGIFDFHSESEILESINKPEPGIGLATTALYLAIGAQCRGNLSSDLRHASALFASGQQLSFQGMLCDPSLEMVRNFLLMAFYMLGACHRNAAFMYLGVAAKAASALGLHRSDQYRDLPTEESRARLNTWKSLRVLDRIVNSILGRSCSLPGILQPDNGVDAPQPGTSNADESSREMALNASFAICPFMDELETRSCRLDRGSAEDFLQRLQTWSKALPEALRTRTDPNSISSASTDRKMFIGGTHVACAYYFVVVLSTRKFLTLHILEQLQEDKSSDQAPRKPAVDDKIISLAQVCLNAAVNLAKVGHNAMTSNQMLNNMCLLKAWMFAAGLVLGFSLFAQDSGPENEVETAFHQARAVLRKLSELSLQAGHYYEILTSLSEATGLYQRKLADERKRKMSQYLDTIFTANTSNEGESGAGSENVDTSPSASLDASNVLDFDQAWLLNGAELDNTTTGPYGLMISEGFPWPADDFSFDWQMPDPLFSEML